MHFFRQTHLVFCAILVVCELVEQGLFHLVVPTNRVDIMFHLREQLPASLVLFSIGLSLCIFARYHVNDTKRKCKSLNAISMYDFRTSVSCLNFPCYCTSTLRLFFLFLNLFINPSSRAYMFFQIRRYLYRILTYNI